MIAPARSRGIFLALVFVVVAVFACSKKDEPSGTLMRANAYVIDDAATRDAIVDATSITFSRAGNEALLDRRPGDVVVGRRGDGSGSNPYGFLRRIRSIGATSDAIVFETEAATLEDAFAQASWSNPISGKHLVSAQTIRAPALTPKDEGDDPTIGDFDLGRHLEFDAGGLRGSIVPSGTLHFNPSYDQIYGHVDLGGLRDAAFVIGGDVHASLTVDAYLEDFMAGGKQTWDLAQASIPLEIPDPPIEITAVIKLQLTCSAKAELRDVHAQFGATLDLDGVAFGITYDRAKGWQAVNKFDPVFHRIGPFVQSEGALDVQCSIGPKLTFLVYDIAGPYVLLDAFAKGRLEVTPQCKLDLWGGFGGKIGLEADIPFTHTQVGSVGFPFTITDDHLYDGAPGDCFGPSLVSAGAGTPVPPLAQYQNHPSRVVVDDTYVYWTNLGTAPDYLDGTVQRVRLDGTDPSPTILASGQSHPNAVAVDGSSIYWTEHGSCAGVELDGKIHVANKDGTNARVLVHDIDEPSAIVVDATYVYWASTAEWPLGAVWRADKDGTHRIALARGLDGPLGLAMDNNYVYWTEYGSGEDDGTSSSVGDGRVARVAKSGGGDLQVIADGELAPAGIAVDLVNVYWANAASAGGGSIRFAPKASTSGATTFEEGQSFPFGVAVDSTNVYWTTADAVLREPKDKSSPAVRLAVVTQEPLSLVPVPSSLTDVAHDLVFTTGGTRRPDDVELGDGEIIDLELTK